jgi:hypothetical protein
MYNSQVDKIKREQIDTVDNLFEKASLRVNEGMETLKEDVRTWDKSLFEPESFELAIFKKQKRDRDLQKMREKMEQTFGTLNLKSKKYTSDKELLAKHYDETMAALKELCKKNNVHPDIFRRLQKQEPNESQLFEMFLTGTDKPHLHYKRSGGFNRAYAKLNLVKKPPTSSQALLDHRVETIKRETRKKEERLKREKEDGKLLKINGIERTTDPKKMAKQKELLKTLRAEAKSTNSKSIK